MIKLLLALINPLSKALDTVDTKIENETDRQRIRADLIKTYANSQVTGMPRLVMFLFVAPVGLWFSSVVYYSMFLCKSCMFPQTWTIAALPAPLDSWSGWIVLTFFAIGASLSKVK